MQFKMTPKANEIILNSIVDTKRFSRNDAGKLCFRYDALEIDTYSGEVKFVNQGTVIATHNLNLRKGDVLHLGSLDGHMEIKLGES